MLNLTSDNIQKAYATKGYKCFTNGDLNLNIFSIRFLDNLDKWTDVRVVLYKVNGIWQIFQTNSTTKPGAFALRHPENPNGCATLKEGQYLDSFVIGFHKGIAESSHRALIQKPNGYALPVYRDFEKDGIIRYDATHLQDNGKGINLHGTYNYGGDVAPPSVFNWSEGCNVISKESDQMAFMDICDKASAIHGMTFSYTLFNINDFI